MAWVRVAAEVIGWSAWFWQNRREFEPALKKVAGIGDFAQATITNPDGAIRRVGNTIVFGQPDGGDRVLAFVEQAAPRVDHIEQAVVGLGAGQAALSFSLGSLQTISMVTVGLSALTPIVLTAQFAALNRKLAALQKLIVNLHKKFDAAVIANLKAGLTLLRGGQDLLATKDEVAARNRLEAALPMCLQSMKYFGELLGGELSHRAAARAEVRLLARHLAVAAVGVASCQISLNQDGHAFAPSASELDLLRQAARHIFQESIGRDPAMYMLPELRDSGVTIEFMARLYQQARDAGAADPAADGSAAAWFEEHRAAIFHARPPSRWRGWNASEMRARLYEAVSAVEETNRVIGLARLVEEVRATGGNTREALEWVRAHMAGIDAEDGEYFAWGLA